MAAGISVPLSDMNGTGRFRRLRRLARRLLDGMAAIILLVLGYGLWRRGTETRLMPRLKRLPHRLMGRRASSAALALAAFVGLGVFIYINTNVWNEYRSQGDQEKLAGRLREDPAALRDHAPAVDRRT